MTIQFTNNQNDLTGPDREQPRALMRRRLRPRRLSAALAAAIAPLQAHAEQLQDIGWKIHETEARYRDLLDRQDDIILRCDAASRVTFVNAAVCERFGVAANMVLGTQFLPQIVTGIRPPALRAEGVTRRQRFQLELETVAGPRWFDFEEQSIAAVTGQADGQIIGQKIGQIDCKITGQSFETQLVGRDITDQRRQEADLAIARDQAEAANRAKSRFLASMSHEIRTPMNGILGMGRLLKDTPLSADQQTYVEAIDRSARTLLALIDEILDFSKIEAGKLALEARTFNLEDCVQSVVELLSPRAAEKGIELAWAIDPALPEMMIGDEVRVRQIITNLIGNAVKFTERGGVLVTVGAEDHAGVADLVTAENAAHAGDAPTPSNDLRLAIAVTDTGIGIPPDIFATLFSEFEQGDPSIHRQHGGTGLGLAISRRLTRAMGGDIHAVSTAGQGSRFTAIVTLQKVRAARPLRAPQTNYDTYHVLLVGLRPQECAALRLTFEGAHVPVEVADVSQAAHVLRAGASNGAPFTVVIIDGGLALDTAACILRSARALADGTQPRGIVMFQTNQRGGYDSLQKLGFSGYLMRPVRPSSLLSQTLAQEHRKENRLPASIIATRPTTVIATDAAISTAIPLPRRLRVLLAEDNDINALVARRMLEHCDCDVTLVTTGRDAVRAVDRSMQTDNTTFDLVLMDMHMPIMDGIEATRTIRANALAALQTKPDQNIKRLRIVALTANAFAEDRLRCLDAGMDDYLAKPFERSDFEALLQRI